MSLEHRVALVTGAARLDGIGQGIARALLQKGLSGLVFTDIEEGRGRASLERLADEFGDHRVAFARHDVTSETDWSSALDLANGRFGGLDILVNNAGTSLPGSIETLSLAELRRGMAVNFDSQFI